MKKVYLVAPLLLGTLPFIIVVQSSIWRIRTPEILLPLSITIACILISMFVINIKVRDITRASIITSFGIILFFSYDYANRLMANFLGARLTFNDLILRNAFLLSAWLVLFILVTYLVLRTRHSLRRLVNFLNIVAFFMVLATGSYTALQKLSVPPVSLYVQQLNLPDIVPSEQAEPLPNIYYIILDRYAAGSTLEDVYGFDNSEFLNYLSKKGFFVASQSTSNYPNTEFSLASSLNMALFDGNGNKADERILDSMIQDNQVWRFLSALGYRFMHFGSQMDGTASNHNADVNVNGRLLGELQRALLSMTPLYPMLYQTSALDIRRDRYSMIQYQFARLGETAGVSPPAFIFSHFILPHPPYVFDRNGNFVTRPQEYERGRRVNYIEQVNFVNREIESLVSRILSESQTPPVIILQADEGPYPERFEYNTRLDWKEATEAELREKMGILNAYYFPNASGGVLYPSITPVNSFRVLFNTYFGTNLALLPDKNYVVDEVRNHTYHFLDVTNLVRYAD